MFKNLANLGTLVKQAQQMGGQMQELTGRLRQQRVTGAAGGGLIEVEANGATGWVNARYLGFATYYEPLPIRMMCSGTEPFWGMELSYTRADVTYAFRDEDFSTEFSAPDSPLNRITIWVRTRVEDESDFLVLEAGTCSDGMSEIAYPYSLLAKLDGNLLGGCCR